MNLENSQEVIKLALWGPIEEEKARRHLSYLPCAGLHRSRLLLVSQHQSATAAVSGTCRDSKDI